MLDIDVDSPAVLYKVLTEAAQSFRETHTELQAAWQDKNAGKLWSKVADKLDQAALLIQKAGY